MNIPVYMEGCALRSSWLECRRDGGKEAGTVRIGALQAWKNLFISCMILGTGNQDLGIGNQSSQFKLHQLLGLEDHFVVGFRF